MPQHETSTEVKDLHACRFCHKILPAETKFCPQCHARQIIEKKDEVNNK